MSPGDQTVTLNDGRTLGYRVFGDAAGYPVIALHGTPGSRFKYAGSHEIAAELGLRLISIDRWGYGLSSPRPGATLSGFADDLAELADRLAIERMHITGVSGGAPFAVAAAARLGARVEGLALVSPVGILRTASGHTWMSPFHALCFRLLPMVPGLIPAVFRGYRAGLAVAPGWMMALAVSRAPAIDREAMRHEETRERLTHAFRTGLSTGVRGPGCDMALFAREWDVDFSAIHAPARIWIGLEDRNVPLAAVMALEAALPRCDVIRLSGEGHLWVARNSQVVMRWLAERTPAPLPV